MFKYLSINWEKYVFRLDKWNFELIGYFELVTDFLAIIKVLLTYIWRLLAKCSPSSFYSACGDRGLSAMYILYLAKLKERGRSFLKGAGKGETG